MHIELAWARLELFPSMPYSSNGAANGAVLGLAFARQRGVHAIASDRRTDFDAWPGELACAAPGVPIFSESAQGGEYLALQLACPPAPMSAARLVFRGDRGAIAIGASVRRAMLAAQPDLAFIEQQAALLLMRAEALLACAPVEPRPQQHARVLDYIEAAIHDSMPAALGLDTLAQLAGMPVLGFLRSFTAVVGATPHAYITERRLQRARLLLRSTTGPVASIALDCGFAHQSHLGAAFKASLGMSPGAYRRRA